MSDLLVKLYDLPPLEPAAERVTTEGLLIKRPLAPERRGVCRWVEQHFNDRWASEVEMAFSGHPISCFVALDAGHRITGFACYNATFRGFFGPIGIAAENRGKGIGAALLLRSLHAMREEGYAYAVIGSAAEPAFFEKVVDATVIPDSDPGPYGNRIVG